MSRKKQFESILFPITCLMLALAVMLSGCGGQAATATQPVAVTTQQVATAIPQPTQAGPKTIHVALVLGDMSNPFFTTLGDAATAEAKALGNVDLTVLGSTTLEEQIKALDDQISAKADVIGFDPFDAQAVIPTVQQANAAGIKVMTVDSSAAGGTIDTYIGTDNVEAERWLASGWRMPWAAKGSWRFSRGMPGTQPTMTGCKVFTA